MKDRRVHTDFEQYEKDPVNGVVVNKDKSSFLARKKFKDGLKSRDNEIKSIHSRMDEIENLLKKLIAKKS